MAHKQPVTSRTLHHACLAGSAAVARYALDAGAPVDGEEEGIQPLHAAARSGQVAVAAVLRGFSLGSVDSIRRFPEFLEVVELG